MKYRISETRDPQFTQRELECLFYLKRGLSAKQTAAILFISPRTVEFHLNGLKEKTQSRTKFELLSKLITFQNNITPVKNQSSILP